METQIAERIATGITTKAKVKATSASLDMDTFEHARFQEIKTLAVANGKLTLLEGQTVYAALGNTVSVFNKQPVHIKAVLTGLFKELMQAHMAAV